MIMTEQAMHETPTRNDQRHFLIALAPRLPRMLAVTGAVVFAAFVAIQFIPQSFEASLTLTPPAGSTAEAELTKIIDQQNLGDVVSRLSPELLADLRRNADGLLDTTLLLNKRLTLAPSADGKALDLSATAGTPTRARALVEAVATGYATLAEPPAPLAQPEGSTTGNAAPPALAASSDDSAIRVLQQKLNLALEERIRLDTRARRIEALAGNGNYAMLAMDTETLPGLGRQIDALATLEAEQARLSVDLLPNHPKMRVIKEEIDALTSDLSEGVQQFAALVAADRDAAQRFEDGLRAQLAEATAPIAVDTSVVTGSISEKPEPKVTALPRPVRTDLALAFTGSFAFLAQIGLFSLFRLRQQPLEEIPGLEYVTDPVDEFASDDALLEEEIVAAEEDHNWLESASPVEVEAAWFAPPEEPSETEASDTPAAIPFNEPTLDEARVVALLGRDDVNAAARRLLARYEELGKRVVLVDAASQRRGRVPGISDLSVGLASFADIVHGSAAEAALVPWGRQQLLDADAKSVRILVQALAELYDVVILSLDDRAEDISLPLAALAELIVEGAALPDFGKKAA